MAQGRKLVVNLDRKRHSLDARIIPTYITCLDTTTQTFSMANTAQAITLNTPIESNNINTPTTSTFEFVETGVYKIVMFPILSKSVGTQMSHFLWLQLDTGAGFVDIPDSNSETVLTSADTNTTQTITFVAVLSFNRGDQIRFMNSTTNTNLELITKTPSAGNGPEIPSVIMSINKLG